MPQYPTVLSAIPTGATPPKPTIFIFDKDYQNPEVHQASAGVERALSDDFAVGISYLFVAARKLQRSTDVNLSAPVATAVPVQGGGSVSIQQFPTARPHSNFDRIISFERPSPPTTV